MKKHLIAAAVAAAVAAPAIAQNVSLYGTLDAGMARFSNIGTGKTDGSGYTDGAIASSVWGLRGSEDLGGGLRAVFQVEGDVFTNNGGTSNAGLFRRAAYAGVAGGFGEITFGLRLNPLIATNGALMPVAGNTVSTLTASALSYNDFYTRNAVTYTSPNLNGLVLQGQYGLGNSFTGGSQGGEVIAGSATLTMGGLTFRAALQDRKDNGVASSANAGVATADTGANSLVSSVGAGAAAFDAKSYVAGLGYQIGALRLAGARISNSEATTVGGTRNTRTATQFGAGYQMNPALLIGGSYTRSEGSSLTNLQARYTLSKRTTAYLNAGVADNSAANRTNFLPYAVNTNTLPATIFTGYAATADQRSTGIGGGLIHNF